MTSNAAPSITAALVLKLAVAGHRGDANARQEATQKLLHMTDTECAWVARNIRRLAKQGIITLR